MSSAVNRQSEEIPVRKITVSALALIGGGIVGFAYGQSGPPESNTLICHVTPDGGEVQMAFSSSSTTAGANGAIAHLANHPDDYSGLCDGRSN